jgi:protein SCO1/2
MVRVMARFLSKSVVWLASIFVAAAMVGCHSGPSGPAGAVKTYPVRGKVVSVNPQDGTALVDLEAIPGFMEAMAMSYKVKDPAALGEMHPGDRFAAKLLVHGNGAGYQAPLLDEVVITAQAKPDYKPSVQYHVPKQGDAVPDFKLVNQSGRSIHLAQFRGRAVLLTFIYTRCQLQEFCPRMSNNFASIDKALADDPPAYAKTHLLSISFDPQHDTPPVLKRYGEDYTGLHEKATFTHWEFAAPSEKELAAMTKFFNMGITPGDAGSLNHSLSTVLIGKDGRVAAWYPTNDWQPAEMVTALKAAAGA